MTLYDFFETKGFEFDGGVSDTTFDIVLTFSVSEDDVKSTDPYFQYQLELAKKIPFIKEFDGAYASAIADFTEFVKKNESKVKKYIKENWKEDWQYVLNDEDDMIYEFIKYMDDGLVGSFGNSTYKSMLSFFKSCK